MADSNRQPGPQSDPPTVQPAAPADPRPAFGLRGEKHAERFLRGRGMVVLARRYRAVGGEIDLIMRDAGTLVFVEVKTRADDRLAEPEHAVNAAKRRSLERCARCFVEHKRLHERPCRFDVVSVLMPAEGEPTLKHFPDAFTPARW